MKDTTVHALTEQVKADLGPTDGWAVPRLYRESTALAIIDSISSIGVRYRGVENVIDRYCTYRRAQGGDPNNDGTLALCVTFDELGIDGWVEEIGNRQKVSTRPATAALKAEVIAEASRQWRDTGIDAADEFLAAFGNEPRELERAWRALPGQRSGVSWRYLLALLGLPSVKPDRMIHGYLHQATGTTFSDVDAVELLSQVAADLRVEPFVLDHNLWRLQRARPRPR